MHRQNEHSKIVNEALAANSLAKISEFDTCYLEDWSQIKKAVQRPAKVVNKEEQVCNSSHNFDAMRKSSMRESSEAHKKPMQSERVIGKITTRNSNCEGALRQTKYSKQAEGKYYHHAKVQKSTKSLKITELGSQQIQQQQGKAGKNLLISFNEKQISAMAKHEEAHANRIEKVFELKIKYIEKIRKMSLPWLKKIPHVSPDRLEQARKKKEVEVEEREAMRKINEITKYKIRRKRSNRHIVQKEKSKDRETKDQEVTQKKEPQILEESETNFLNQQVSLLKSWLDIHRQNRKVSITSLLRQHFESKYIQKKRQREMTSSRKLANFLKANQ